MALRVATLAFLTRVVLLFTLPHAETVSDALLYDNAARKLGGVAEGQPLEMFYRGFGYPIFLAPIYALGGGYIAVRLANAVLWALTIGLVVLVAERLYGRRTAIVTAGLLFAPLLLLSHFLWTLTENLLAFEIAAAVAVLLLVVPVRPRFGAAAAGVLLAAAALTHPGWQLFVIVGILLLRARREIGIAAAAAVAVMLVVFIPMHLAFPGQPWTYGQGNKGYGGGSAWTFYVGTHVDNGGVPTAEDYEAADEGSHPDSYYWRAGAHNIVHDPVGSVGLWFAKAWRLWTAASHYPTGSATFDRLIDYIHPIAGALVLILGLTGAAAIRGRPMLVLVAPVLYAILVFATLTSGEPRYVLAAMPLAAVPAAALIVGLAAHPPRPARSEAA